jgi:thiol-disulfide isomerase/thioredoxin
MRCKLIWISLLLVVFLSACKPDAVDIYGRPIQMSNYKGRWVVINYWATWCTPCISEIAELIKLKTYYPQVVILGVNPDNLDKNVLQQLSQDYGVNYDFLTEFPIEDWGGKKPTDLPVTFIISPKGKLYQTLVGPQTLSSFQSVMNLPPITYQ